MKNNGVRKCPIVVEIKLTKQIGIVMIDQAFQQIIPPVLIPDQLCWIQKSLINSAHTSKGLEFTHPTSGQIQCERNPTGGNKLHESVPYRVKLPPDFEILNPPSLIVS